MSKAEKVKVTEPPSVECGMLVSSLDHPVELCYMGSAMMMPPRGKLPIDNIKFLGAIPKGVILLRGVKRVS